MKNRSKNTIVFFTLLLCGVSNASASGPTVESEVPDQACRTVTGFARVRGRGGLGAMSAARADAVEQCRSDVIQISRWSIGVEFGPMFTATANFQCVNSEDPSNSCGENKDQLEL